MAEAEIKLTLTPCTESLVHVHVSHFQTRISLTKKKKDSLNHNPIQMQMESQTSAKQRGGAIIGKSRRRARCSSGIIVCKDKWGISQSRGQQLDHGCLLHNVCSTGIFTSQLFRVRSCSYVEGDAVLMPGVGRQVGLN